MRERRTSWAAPGKAAPGELGPVCAPATGGAWAGWGEPSAGPPGRCRAWSPPAARRGCGSWGCSAWGGGGSGAAPPRPSDPQGAARGWGWNQGLGGSPAEWSPNLPGHGAGHWLGGPCPAGAGGAGRLCDPSLSQAVSWGRGLPGDTGRVQLGCAPGQAVSAFTPLVQILRHSGTSAGSDTSSWSRCHQLLLPLRSPRYHSWAPSWSLDTSHWPRVTQRVPITRSGNCTVLDSFGFGSFNMAGAIFWLTNPSL